ncbi:MAG: hypothetical protein ABJO02_20055 [Reichenbachiella sp.]|uniref:hypothetical protein n=1 Tax=Reichenbachiella sp. TaxID=2184521 RepID=UPI00329A578A
MKCLITISLLIQFFVCLGQDDIVIVGELKILGGYSYLNATGHIMLNGNETGISDKFKTRKGRHTYKEVIKIEGEDVTIDIKINQPLCLLDWNEETLIISDRKWTAYAKSREGFSNDIIRSKSSEELNSKYLEFKQLAKQNVSSSIDFIYIVFMDYHNAFNEIDFKMEVLSDMLDILNMEMLSTRKSQIIFQQYFGHLSKMARLQSKEIYELINDNFVLKSEWSKMLVKFNEKFGTDIEHGPNSSLDEIKSQVISIRSSF